MTCLVLVLGRLAAKRARRALNDSREREPDEQQPDRECDVEPLGIARDGGGHGGVAQMDLEGTGGALSLAESQRHERLDHLAAGSLVVADAGPAVSTKSKCKPVLARRLASDQRVLGRVHDTTAGVPDHDLLHIRVRVSRAKLAVERVHGLGGQAVVDVDGGNLRQDPETRYQLSRLLRIGEGAIVHLRGERFSQHQAERRQAHEAENAEAPQQTQPGQPLTAEWTHT